MRNLELVCQQMSLPPVEAFDVNGVTKLAELILDQTKGELRNNHRVRSRKDGLPSQIGEMLTQDLFTTWLNDKDKLPFDCKLQTFILTKLLQDKGVDAQVSFYRHSHHSPHPFVRIVEADQQILVGFDVGFTPQRGFFHEQDVSVQEMSQADRKTFDEQYYTFRDLDQAIRFADLRQEYNFVYCNQQLDTLVREQKLSQLRDKLWAVVT